MAPSIGIGAVDAGAEPVPAHAHEAPIPKVQGGGGQRARRKGAKAGSTGGFSEILQCRYATVQDHPSAGVAARVLPETPRRTLKGKDPTKDLPEFAP